MFFLLTLTAVGCEGCHGGDPTLEDMDEVRESPGWRGVPDHLEVPEFCARCHSDAAYMHEHNPSLPVDQLDKFRTSYHGKRIFEHRDKKAANCISCHGAHEIAGADLPFSKTHPLNLPATCGTCHADADYMAEYGIPTDQLDDYTQSVHGKALLENHDLGAPACNDCHGNHGAAPPGISSVSAVCGVCHAIQEELFTNSPHEQAYRENDFPMCETCHSNHLVENPGDDWLGSEEPALCIECHADDDGTQGIAVADSMKAVIRTLASREQEAREILGDAQLKGMHTTDEEFLMKEVDQALIQTRTLIHLLDKDSVAGRGAEGIAKADTVITNSADLIDEYYFRRKGLTVATLIITILAIALYIRIRRLPG
jgi:predicted CXXCH cytochrome family protein